MKIAILYSEYSPTIDAVKSKLDGHDVVCTSQLSKDMLLCDLVISVHYEGSIPVNAVAIHHSLLPSFNTDEPVRDAILAGVKVTGLTVYYTETKKIITQYPVFIYNDAHYDELKNELDYLEQMIYPLVVEKLVKNEPFEIQSLINGGSCARCSGCRH